MIGPVEIDRRVFDRAAPHAEAALQEMGRIYADPARTCTPSDDLRDDVIVI